MPSMELVDLYQRAQDAARRLEAEGAEIHELAKRLETLTKDTPAHEVVASLLALKLRLNGM